ncbi:MAG: hypothetical protein R3F11_12355 [Verrucomicrobiales bacterium]
MRLTLLASLALAAPCLAQVSTAPQEGLRDETPRLHVLRGADVVPEPGKRIAGGVVVVRDGRIAAVGGSDLETPTARGNGICPAR